VEVWVSLPFSVQDYLGDSPMFVGRDVKNSDPRRSVAFDVTGSHAAWWGVARVSGAPLLSADQVFVAAARRAAGHWVGQFTLWAVPVAHAIGDGSDWGLRALFVVQSAATMARVKFVFSRAAHYAGLVLAWRFGGLSPI
jgi:hypothetical protein